MFCDECIYNYLYIYIFILCGYIMDEMFSFYEGTMYIPWIMPALKQCCIFQYFENMKSKKYKSKYFRNNIYETQKYFRLRDICNHKKMTHIHMIYWTRIVVMVFIAEIVSCGDVPIYSDCNSQFERIIQKSYSCNADKIFSPEFVCFQLIDSLSQLTKTIYVGPT